MLSSVAIAIHNVLLHFCLALRREEEHVGDVWVRRYRSHHLWQVAFVTLIRSVLRPKCVCVCVAGATSYLCFSLPTAFFLSLSICPSLLPLADHMPQSVSGARPPQAQAVLVQRQIAQCAPDTHTQVGRRVKHAYTHGMLPFSLLEATKHVFSPR